MIARSFRHGLGAALAVLLVVGLASRGLTQTDALSQKATEAAEITAIAQQNGHVRIIVLFDSPVPANQLKSDPSGVANVKSQVAAIQDAIIATHFTSATAPAQGQGYDRGISRFPITPGFAVNVNQAELDALAADPRVKAINYDRAVPHSLIDSVPLIGMNTAYSLGATGTGQAVAILDTGVQSNHEFLAGKVVAEACFSNAGGGGGNVTLCPNGTSSQTGAGAANAETAQCINGGTNLCEHGTHVAGIAAGLNTNQQGGEPPNGVAKNAKILAIQIFTRFNGAGDCSGAPPCVLTYNSDQVLALDHVFANINLGGGTVVASANMSLGGGLFSGTCDGSSQKPSIDNLRAAGALTAIAAGNNGSTSQISSPGCISTAFTVGSTTKADAVSSFSNMSSVVDVLAPGSSIQSSIPVVPSSTTTYSFFNGTSMAAPHVAGAIAAIRTACPNATADAIENALKSTGTPITDTRTGGTQTKPRIRVDLAVQSLNCGPPAPASVSLLANGQPNILIGPGTSYTLSYSSSNVSSCTLAYTRGDGYSPPNDSFPFPANLSGSASSGLIGSYTLACNGLNGNTVAKTVTINVPGPSLSLLINGGTSATVIPGASYIISYSSNNVSSCTMFYARGDGYLPLTGSFPFPANLSGSASSGLIGSYTLACIALNGQKLAKTTAISSSVSGVSLLANGQPNILIGPGASYTLSYSSSNVSACTLAYTRGDSYSPPNDSFPFPATVSGSASSGLIGSYTLGCTDENGEDPARSVAINSPDSNLSLLVNGQDAITVNPGASYTLSYSSSNVSACTLAYTRGDSYLPPNDSFPFPANVSGSASSGLIGSYTLACTDQNAQKIAKSVGINASP